MPTHKDGDCACSRAYALSYRRVRQQYGRMRELGGGGSRLTQCSGSPRYGAPTSRRSCIQGLEAHARPSKLTAHPSLGSPFTHAIRAGLSHRACPSNCHHISFVRQNRNSREFHHRALDRQRQPARWRSTGPAGMLTWESQSSMSYPMLMPLAHDPYRQETELAINIRKATSIEEVSPKRTSATSETADGSSL